MSLIEGIGDEVTVLAACLLVLAIIFVAWASTLVDVRTYTGVSIINGDHFGELLRRIQGFAVRAGFASEIDTDDLSHSSADAAELHSLADSLLLSNAAADGVIDVKPQSLHDTDVDDLQSGDGELKCVHESETENTAGSLKCESASTSKPNTNCSESALSFQNAATASFANDTLPNSIQVRLQFVDGRQRTVFANPDDTIGHFKRYDCTHIQ